MAHLHTITLFLSAALVAGCSSGGSSNPPAGNGPVGVASNAGGIYSVLTDGTTHTVAGTMVTNGPLLTWSGVDMKAGGYETADVLALSGVYNGSHGSFAGINGVLSAPDTTFQGLYKGDFTTSYVNTKGNVQTYTAINMLDITVDFGAGTLSGTAGSDYSIEGSITGSQFTGTVQLPTNLTQTPTPAIMEGGFFTNETIAGAFVGDGKAGVLGVIISTFAANTPLRRRRSLPRYA